MSRSYLGSAKLVGRFAIAAAGALNPDCANSAGWRFALLCLVPSRRELALSYGRAAVVQPPGVVCIIMSTLSRLLNWRAQAARTSATECRDDDDEQA